MSNHDPFLALSTSLILMVKDELDAQLQGSHIGQRQITQFNKLHQPSFYTYFLAPFSAWSIELSLVSGHYARSKFPRVFAYRKTNSHPTSAGIVELKSQKHEETVSFAVLPRFTTTTPKSILFIPPQYTKLIQSHPVMWVWLRKLYIVLHEEQIIKRHFHVSNDIIIFVHDKIQAKMIPKIKKLKKRNRLWALE